MLPFLISLVLLLFPKSALAAQSADLEITASTISLSENYYQYRITAANNGPDPAERFIISSPIPQGVSGFITHVIKGIPEGCADFTPTQFSLCFPSMPSGGSVFVDIVINVTDPNLTAISHLISVSASTPDPDNSDNNYTLTVVLPNQNPVSKDSCKNSLWQTFARFKNQGQCIKSLVSRR